jgi:hypothetical protein
MNQAHGPDIYGAACESIILAAWQSDKRLYSSASQNIAKPPLSDHIGCLVVPWAPDE